MTAQNSNTEESFTPSDVHGDEEAKNIEPTPVAPSADSISVITSDNGTTEVYGLQEKHGSHKGHRHRRHRTRRRSSQETMEVYGLGAKPTHHHHHHHRSSSSRRRRKKATIYLGAALAAVFLILCIGAICLASLNKSMSLNSEEKDALVTALVEEKEAVKETQNNGFYVLLVGSDAREGDTFSRGDVLMLVRVDPTEHKITLVSIPRDTMVNISGGYGTQKINASYAFGGAPTAIYEVSKFAGVPISHYAEIDFAGLEKVVDLLGGVWVDVPEAIPYADNESGYIEAGHQLLDGKAALAYARNRHDASGGDFGRAQAQRLIVEAIIKQLMRANTFELPKLINALAECVSTDYGVTDVVSLATQFYGNKTVIYQAACPSYAFWQDGIAYVGTMFDEWRDMMKRVDAGLDPNDTSVEIPEPQASSKTLGQAANSAAPKDYKELAANAMTTDAVVEAESETVIN